MGKVKNEKEVGEGYREDKTGTARICVWRCDDPCEVGSTLLLDYEDLGKFLVEVPFTLRGSQIG